MGLTMRERRAVTRESAGKYRKAAKKKKGGILNEYCELTGYSRKHAITVLNNWGKSRLMWIDGKLVQVVGGQPHRSKKHRRKKPKVYDERVFKVVKKIWYLFDCMCGKRLVQVLRTMLPLLEKYGEVELDEQLREKLNTISAATIDRGLCKEKQKFKLKGRSHTKPGSLLKHQIPIRTFSQWQDLKLGYVQVDLVGHDGSDTSGEFAYTLDMVEVRSGWTEPYAVKNRAQKWVFEALLAVKARLPLKLLGLSSDNGSEFINAHLLRYCKQHGIDFTRSRANKKNDNCYVEQKNASVIRRAVGYLRYQSDEQVALLNQLYSKLRLLVNFFYPSMKLKQKSRRGSVVKKRYEIPKTPYQRLLESEEVAEATKQALKAEFEGLNPAELQRQIGELRERLFQSAKLEQPSMPETAVQWQRRGSEGERKSHQRALR